jgi:hypothetical protein
MIIVGDVSSVKLTMQQLSFLTGPSDQFIKER